MSRTKATENPFKYLSTDLPAGIIVFLVAMPLCLGIALASGAPLFSGLIAGIIGGIVVGILSDSPLGVSGPAAGLAVIVLKAIHDLGSFEIFLGAVVLCGLLQVVLGFLRAGIIAYYFPSAVIRGMLAGIGIIIILKQIPHGFGYLKSPESNLGFFQPQQNNSVSELYYLLDGISLGPTLIMLVSMVILVGWETKFIKKFKIFQLVQGPLVAVVVGILLNLTFKNWEGFSLQPSQLVNIPLAASVSDFFANFRFPDPQAFVNPAVYLTAAILAIVGSLETLLCVEASDKQDPWRRVTPANRELKAQGVGNILSGLIGGLPITQVIVRSSVNVQAGGRTKMSAIFHGFLILISIILIPDLLNLIPLSALAAILFMVGYKLAKPELFKKVYRQGVDQFIPFMATIVGIVFSDLLIGILIGLVVAIFFILYRNFLIPVSVRQLVDEGGRLEIELGADVSFLKKASFLALFNEIPAGSTVIINAKNNYYIHQDVLDIIEDFMISAKDRKIRVECLELYEHKQNDPMAQFGVKH